MGWLENRDKGLRLRREIRLYMRTIVKVGYVVVRLGRGCKGERKERWETGG